MNAKIIIIIGARKSGKTCVSELIHNYYPEWPRISAWAFPLAEFLELHAMSAEAFYAPSVKEENRNLLYIYSEHKRSKDKFISLKQLVPYINKLPGVIIEDLYYFNELEAFMKLGARVLLVDADHKIRQDRGLTKSMSMHPWELEVSSISVDMVKTWKNVTVIKNDKSTNELRVRVREVV